jgi:hypothetical protein
VALFDQHITSAPSDPTFSCLSVGQMLNKGWQKDARGRWFDPVKLAKARESFRKLATASA